VLAPKACYEHGSYRSVDGGIDVPVNGLDSLRSLLAKKSKPEELSDTQRELLEGLRDDPRYAGALSNLPLVAPPKQEPEYLDALRSAVCKFEDVL
jgi:hypothetical protein